MISFFLRHRIISTFHDLDIRGVRKIAHFLPRLLLPKPGRAAAIKTLYGFYLNIDPLNDDGIDESIYYTGTYEKGTLWVLKQILSEGNIFVDVGANIGLMSILASSLVKKSGKVVAFEPNPVTMEILKENIALNNLSNIEISEYAIGSSDKTSRLYQRKDQNRGCASLIETEFEADIYDIQVIPLSSYFNQHDTIDLIKIDIEGFELEALIGAREFLLGNSPPKLILECSEMRKNTSHSGFGGLYEFLTGLNQYRLFKSKGGKGRVSRLIEIRTQSDMPQHDNIYCFTRKHLSEIPGNIFINR